MASQNHSTTEVLEDGPAHGGLRSHAFFASSPAPKGRQGSSKHRVASSTPPFRISGRGSKQLSKAIEKSSLERSEAGDASGHPQWAFCFGKHPCFAKILSLNSSSQASNSAIIQPMFSDDNDPYLFTLWEGHLWLAKLDKIYPVKMKQEIGGWRLHLTRELQVLLKQFTKPGSFRRLPASLGKVSTSGENWDLVSLESSDLDDCSSVTSSMVFPMLDTSHRLQKKGDADASKTTQSNGTCGIAKDSNNVTPSHQSYRNKTTMSLDKTAAVLSYKKDNHKGSGTIQDRSNDSNPKSPTSAPVDQSQQKTYFASPGLCHSRLISKPNEAVPLKPTNVASSNLRIPPSINSPAPSTSSSALSPCMLPCPSSAGSNRSTPDDDSESTCFPCHDGEECFSSYLCNDSDSLLAQSNCKILANPLSPSAAEVSNSDERDELPSASLDVGIALLNKKYVDCTPQGGDASVSPPLSKGIAVANPSFLDKNNSRSTSPPANKGIAFECTTVERQSRPKHSLADILPGGSNCYDSCDHVAPADQSLSSEDERIERCSDIDSQCSTSAEGEIDTNTVSPQLIEAKTIIDDSSSPLKKQLVKIVDEEHVSSFSASSESTVPLPKAPPLKKRKELSAFSTRETRKKPSSKLPHGSKDTELLCRKRPRRAASSTSVHRDAVFGSWPTRTQSASQGTWKL